MQKIQFRDAKATLSAVVDDALRGKPTVITRHGKRQAVVLSYAEWDRLAARVARHADRPLALVDIGDARHLRAFGFDSLFGSTLTRIGLRNAWSEATAFSFLAPVPLERLADMPDGGWRHMLCVEAAQVYSPITLPAGGRWAGWQRLHVLKP